MEQNSLIRTALRNLGQKMVNLHISLTNLMTTGFLKQKELFSQVEDKLDDFLIGKIIFNLIPIKICLQPQGTSSISLNMLDLIFHSLVANVLSSSAIAINNHPSSLRSRDLATLTPALDSRSAFSV